MANMGYCRFTNTLQDLRDCQDHMDDSDLNEEEQRARKRLITVCMQIAHDFDPEDDE